MRWNDGLVNAFPVPIDGSILAHHETTNGNRQGVTSISKAHECPFNFLGLPREIRDQIYQILLFGHKRPFGLEGESAILYVSKQCNEEASRILYSTVIFRIFRKQEFNHLPTILEIPSRHHKWITSLEMVVGSSWTDPPESWRMTKPLARCLSSLGAARTLEIFVEADPSNSIFAKYRVSETFYTEFCGSLLKDVLDEMPQLKTVELDGLSFVQRDGPLVSRLREEAERQGKLIKWGKRNFGASTRAQRWLTSNRDAE